MATQYMPHIGTKELVGLPDYGINDVPAKVDTGADSSAIWVSQIQEKAGELSFVLFGPVSPFYTGEIIRTRQFSMVKVKNSFGHEQERYKVNLKIRIADRNIKVRITLADRSSNRYPILIGRRTIKGKFLVDVSKINLPKTTHSLLFLYSEGKSSPNDFFNYANQSGLSIYGANYEDIIFRTGDNNKISILRTGEDLASFAAVYFNRVASSHRGYGHIASAIAQYLEARNVEFIDRSVINAQDPSKLHQYIVLTDHHIRVPQTIFMFNDQMAENYDMIVQELGLPFVLKDDLGKRGRHRYFIENKADFDRALSQCKEELVWLLAQKYVVNDTNYRLLVMGDRVEVVIRRSQAANNSKKTLDNTTLVDISEIPQKVLRDSVLAAKLLQLQIAGVDVMQDKSTKLWYCLEVNKSPQIYSGQYIDAKQAGLVRYLKRRLPD